MPSREALAESTSSASGLWAATICGLTSDDAQMMMSAPAITRAPRSVIRSGAPGPAPTKTTSPRRIGVNQRW